MYQLTVPIAAGIAALAVTLGTGYFIMKRKQRAEKPHPYWKNPVPLLCGLLAGFLVLGGFAETYIAIDRFYEAKEALKVLAVVMAGCLLLWSVELVLPRKKVSVYKRAAGHIAAQVLAAGLLVWAGVRFNLMNIPGQGVTQLEPVLSALLTMIWLILCTNVIRLLDGIHGAASVAVVIAGITGLYANTGQDEYFLTGVTLVAIGCAAGSLQFCMSRRRLPLEGAGTALIGFLFATLTVLARQKTEAALLLLVPVVLIFLIAGAAMMGLLEKRLLLPRDDK